ncbi:hypothetical protein Bca4012_081984 [Brassica carinata]
MQGNTTEGDGKQSEVKEKLPIKRSRGSLGSLNMIRGKNSGASANGTYSKRHWGRVLLMVQVKEVMQTLRITLDPFQSIIGGAPTSAAAPVRGVVAPVSRDGGGHSQPWLQSSERQRRKQSNRESARRSRLSKQAECNELGQRAEVLNEENASLRAEINKLRSQCEELTSGNSFFNPCMFK